MLTIDLNRMTGLIRPGSHHLSGYSMSKPV